MASTIDRAGIAATHAVIAPYVRVTPVLEVTGEDFGLPPFPLLLKLEHLQHSGSFGGNTMVVDWGEAPAA